MNRAFTVERFREVRAAQAEQGRTAERRGVFVVHWPPAGWLLQAWFPREGQWHLEPIRTARGDPRIWRNFESLYRFLQGSGVPAADMTLRDLGDMAKHWKRGAA